jgi:hypothetical protein
MPSPSLKWRNCAISGTDAIIEKPHFIGRFSAYQMTEKLGCWYRWRREWDSNPRYGFPHTRFPSVRLKPLGHLSGCLLLKGQEDFCKGARPR